MIQYNMIQNNADLTLYVVLSLDSQQGNIIN